MTSDIDTDPTPDAEWQGTADATLSASPTPSLYEISGLNPKYWEIVGLDITANAHGNSPAFTFIVYAVDRRGGRAVEVDAEGRVALARDVAGAVREAIAVDCDVALVPPTVGLPTTTSGKLSRARTKANYLAGLYAAKPAAA